MGDNVRTREKNFTKSNVCWRWNCPQSSVNLVKAGTELITWMVFVRLDWCYKPGSLYTACYKPRHVHQCSEHTSNSHVYTQRQRNLAFSLLFPWSSSVKCEEFCRTVPDHVAVSQTSCGNEDNSRPMRSVLYNQCCTTRLKWLEDAPTWPCVFLSAHNQILIRNSCSLNS
jgi:hypothetical protein